MEKLIGFHENGSVSYYRTMEKVAKFFGYKRNSKESEEKCAVKSAEIMKKFYPEEEETMQAILWHLQPAL